MTRSPRLSPTSYALLGLLARKPQSAYELNTVMQTSLIRVFWPRAESHVYSEPKKLLAHDLVSEQHEKVNGRSRTVYTITEKGSQALSGWLGEDTEAQLRSQAEFMLKLILADSGSDTTVRKTLQCAEQTARSELEIALAGIEKVLENPGSAVEGMPYNGFAINLMADILIARLRWSEYAREAAAGLTDDIGEDERSELGAEAYQRALQRMLDAM